MPKISKPKISAPKITAPKIIKDVVPKNVAKKLDPKKVVADVKNAKVVPKINTQGKVTTQKAPIPKALSQGSLKAGYNKNVEPVVKAGLKTPTKTIVNAVKNPTAKNIGNALNTPSTALRDVAKASTNVASNILTGKDVIPNKNTQTSKTTTTNPPAPPAGKPGVPGAPTGVPGSNPNDLNHWGINRPTRFETLNPDGTAKSQYQVDYKNERDMSPWAKMMQKNETDRFNASKSDVLASSMAGANSGMNSLARQGGLTGGARVALMNQANQGAIGAQQNLANQYQGRMSGIATDDITRQQSIDERNANTSLGQVDKSFDAKFNVYQEMLKKNASDYMADAIQNGAAGNQTDPNAPKNQLGGKNMEKIRGMIGDSGKMDPVFNGEYDPMSRNFGGWGMGIGQRK